MVEDYFYDWDLKSFPIPSSYGHGIEIIHNEKKYHSVGYFDKKGYREATFTVTSWIGSGVGIHYYGSICLSVNIKEDETGYGVFIPGMKIPTECKSRHIDIIRPIQEWELKKGYYDPKFFNMESKVAGFYTEEELIKVFKENIDNIFTGKWKITCDYWNTSEDIFIDK